MKSIGEALEMFAPWKPPTQFFVGRDPLFAGLHDIEDTDDGRSYRTIAHACYPWNISGPASRRQATIVLPTSADLDVVVVVHELGHILDWATGFSCDVEPVTRYGQTNREEAFAEAVTASLLQDYAPWSHPEPRLKNLLVELGVGTP